MKGCSIITPSAQGGAVGGNSITGRIGRRCLLLPRGGGARAPARTWIFTGPTGKFGDISPLRPKRMGVPTAAAHRHQQQRHSCARPCDRLYECASFTHHLAVEGLQGRRISSASVRGVRRDARGARPDGLAGAARRSCVGRDAAAIPPSSTQAAPRAAPARRSGPPGARGDLIDPIRGARRRRSRCHRTTCRTSCCPPRIREFPTRWKPSACAPGAAPWLDG